MHRLVRHPLTPASSVEAVSAHVADLATTTMTVEFNVKSASMLVLPPETGLVRADDLWRTTCFEVFLQRDRDAGYFELNFSPSFAWAAYAFDGYREGMRELPVTTPPDIALTLPGRIDASVPEQYFSLWAEFEISPPLRTARRLGLSAVIEETDGTKSYWALAHPPGKPDFHHPDCFALTLPAPGGA